MTRQSVIFGIPAPTSILVPKDTSGVIKSSATMSGVLNGLHTLSGALTADTYAEIIAISTKGWIMLCGVYRIDATSRTLGLKIVIDGTTVMDDVDGAAGQTDRGWFGVGAKDTPNGGQDIAWIPFNSSLSLQIKSSITETDKIALIHSVATV